MGASRRPAEAGQTGNCSPAASPESWRSQYHRPHGSKLAAFLWTPCPWQAHCISSFLPSCCQTHRTMPVHVWPSPWPATGTLRWSWGTLGKSAQSALSVATPALPPEQARTAKDGDLSVCAEKIRCCCSIAPFRSAKQFLCAVSLCGGGLV